MAAGDYLHRDVILNERPVSLPIRQRGGGMTARTAILMSAEGLVD